MLHACHCREKREQLKTFQDLLPESQGQHVTLTVLCVSYSLGTHQVPKRIGLRKVYLDDEPLFQKGISLWSRANTVGVGSDWIQVVGLPGYASRVGWGGGRSNEPLV